LEGSTLHQLDGVLACIKEVVCHVFDRLIQRPDGAEMPVDEIVQKAVQQEGRAVLGQVTRRVPAIDHRAHIERGVLANGDRGVVGDKRRDLVGNQLARLLIQCRRVCDKNRWVR
jgi:hypothetical protein